MLVWGLCLYAALSVANGVGDALLPSGGQDLGPPYTSARLWLRGIDPYEARPHAERRALADVGDDLPDQELQVAPATPYPFVALVNLAPLSALDWPLASRLWLILNLVLAAAVPAIILRTWLRQWSTAARVGCVALWFAGLGLRSGLGQGQHAVFAFAIALAALALVRRGRTGEVLAGLLLALALHKFSLTLPVVLYVGLLGYYRALAATLAGLLVLAALFVVRVDAPPAVVFSHYLASLAWWDRVWYGDLVIGESGTIGSFGTGQTSLFPLFAAALPTLGMAKLALLGTGAAVTIACCFLHGLRSRAAPTPPWIAVFLLLSLVFSYHETTDTLPVILAIAALVEARQRGTHHVVWRRALSVGLVLALGVWLLDAAKLDVFVQIAAGMGLSPGTGYFVLDAAYRLALLLTLVLLVLAQRPGESAASTGVTGGGPERGRAAGPPGGQADHGRRVDLPAPERAAGALLARFSPARPCRLWAHGWWVAALPPGPRWWLGTPGR
jgi:hypothetical protein